MQQQGNVANARAGSSRGNRDGTATDPPLAVTCSMNVTAV